MNARLERIGIVSVLASAVAWGLFPVLIHLGVQSISPLALLISTYVVAFAGAIVYGLYVGSLSELRQVKYYGRLILIAVLIIIIPSTLFYLGARHSSGVNTSMLTLTEIVFTVLFAKFFGEQLTLNKIIGAAGVLVGAILLSYQPGGSFLWGDLLIALSTITYPAGNYMQKKILNHISPASLLVGRIGLSIPVLWFMYFIFDQQPTHWLGVMQQHWLLISVIGLITMCAAKIFWFYSLKYLEVTKAISLVMTFPLFSLLFLWLLGSKESISYQQFWGIITMVVGVYFAIRRPSTSIQPQPI